MKTKVLMMTIIASLTLMVSATVWEGVTDVVSTRDMPGNYSVATNAFPRNSVVDITNLENGKMVRALVVSGLETTGLLATLSRNAADSIDLRGNSTCRIRITQPSDDIAFSHFKLGPIAAPPAGPPTGSPAGPPAAASEQNVIFENNVSEGTDRSDRDKTQNHITIVESDAGIDAAANTRTDYPIAAEGVTGIAAVTVLEENEEPAEEITGTAFGTRAEIAQEDAVVEPAIRESTGTMTTARAAEMTPKNTVAESADETPEDTVDTFAYIAAEPVSTAVAQPAAPAVENPSESENTFGNLSIIPWEERIPEAENKFVVAPEELAPPLKKTEYAASPSETSDFSPFQVPLISQLERDKWYVQLAAYKRVDHVEDEINRIGAAYPVAIQNIGSDSNPMFRILLGPLNQGESGAILQRFKSIGYSDAFIRHN